MGTLYWFLHTYLDPGHTYRKDHGYILLVFAYILSPWTHTHTHTYTLRFWIRRDYECIVFVFTYILRLWMHTLQVSVAKVVNIIKVYVYVYTYSDSVKLYARMHTYIHTHIHTYSDSGRAHCKSPSLK
jgi:hypothetical protein